MSDSENKACYCGCLKEASKSVQVLLNRIYAVMVLNLKTLDDRPQNNEGMSFGT